MNYQPALQELIAAFQTGKSFEYRLMPISILVEMLVNEADHLRELNGFNRGAAGAIGEHHALQLLRDHGYDFVLELGCNWHRMV